MAIKPVFNPFPTRPPTLRSKSAFVAWHTMMRDQFSIASWLVFGALIQGLAHVFLPYRNIVLILPVIMVISYKIIHTALLLTNILPNPYMKDIVPFRAGLVMPDEKGSQQNPGEVPMCAILLSVICNHPLGILGPGWKESGEAFDAMTDELSADATKYGFLGASSWVSASGRTTANQMANMLYFENEEYMSAYAHGPLHTKTMQWWHKMAAINTHMGIMHEIFSCPKKGWEGVYLNYPLSGLGAATKEVTAPDGKKSWVSPLVKARGKLLSSRGRMGQKLSDSGWDALGVALKDEAQDL